MSVELEFLELANGRSPFEEWESRLDPPTRGMVRVRLNRVRLGNFGDCKAIKGSRGLLELRIHVGAGYRIYLGKAKDTLVIILCGGEKGSQERDIAKATEYWQWYQESRLEGKNGQSKNKKI